MAQQKAAEVKKKGFFSRKKDAPAPAPPKPATMAAKPAALPKPAPAPAVEPRISLESMPEVEKRIDRMRATQRRASLLERYEKRYGEKLDVPNVFVPVEEEKEEEPVPTEAATPAPAADSAPQPAAVPAAAKPAAPALPPKDVKLPAASTAVIVAKPTAVAAKPGAAVIAAKPAAPAPKPAAPPKPSKPSPINGRSFWKYLWPYWRLPLRNLAKYYVPDNKGAIMGATVADLPLWVILAIPRIVFCPIGLAATFLMKRKAKQANGDKPETVVAAD